MSTIADQNLIASGGMASLIRIGGVGADPGRSGYAIGASRFHSPETKELAP